MDKVPALKDFPPDVQKGVIRILLEVQRRMQKEAQSKQAN